MLNQVLVKKFLDLSLRLFGSGLPYLYILQFSNLELSRPRPNDNECHVIKNNEIKEKILHTDDFC